MSIRLVISAIVGTLIIVNCSSKDKESKVLPQPTKPPEVSRCSATYREASDELGKMFQFQSFYVRCFGVVGQSRANCIWRR